MQRPSRIVSEKLKQVQPLPVWMTETQLAEYWQLRNRDGELTVDSIRKWTARPEEEHPLPCANMGDLRRYNREEVDQWAKEEAVRQRVRRAGKGDEHSKKTRHLQAVGEP